MTRLQSIQVPSGLLGSILTRIALARRRAAWIRLCAFSIVLAASVAALVPAIDYATNQFYESGFYDYLSLFFSDWSAVVAHWRALSETLVESVPSLSILFLLALTFCLSWALRRIMRNVRIAFAPIQLS